MPKKKRKTKNAKLVKGELDLGLEEFVDQLYLLPVEFRASIAQKIVNRLLIEIPKFKKEQDEAIRLMFFNNIPNRKKVK